MPHIGQIFSHYRLISVIGAGGMGEVYLAQDTKLDRRVALKILPEEFAADNERMNRFIREAKSASALNHPNIITIYEIGESEGTHYIATEFIDGKTLSDYAKDSPLNLRSVLEMAIQIASALQIAHSANIIHRDIKPDNVMIRQDGLAKILDFGIAKSPEKLKPEIESEDATAIKQLSTSPGMIIGTANYMSPEQAKGQAVDARTDIFSFGVLLYEMLAGYLPFEGETPMETISSIIKDEPKPLNDSDVPPEINRIINKCLRKNRDERYQTIKDLMIDLKDVKQELEFQDKLEKTVQPEKEEQRTQILKAKTIDELKQTTTGENRNDSIKINKSGIGKAIIAILAVLLIAAIGLGYWFYSGSSSKQFNSIAVMPFVNESGNQDIEYLSDGMTETLISSLTEIPNLSVKARSTVFYYKGKEKSVKEIGEELNVEAVLLGRVVQRGEDLKLTLELVNPKTLDAIWSETYNRKMSDLVALQSEIARNVSDKLRLKLTADEQKQVAKTYTTNSEAQQFYLQGRFHWNKRNTEGFLKAKDYFQKAIALDPNYALAYSGLADTYGLIPNYDSFSPKQYYPLAKQAAEKALELDPNSAETHASLGGILVNDYDFQGAERELRKAIEINPKYPPAYQWLAELLSSQGRLDEALAEINKALELDPFSLINNRVKGTFLIDSGRTDEAIAQLKKTVELFPDDATAHGNLAEAYEQKKMYDEAVEHFLIRAKMQGIPPENIKKVREHYKKEGWNGFWRQVVEFMLEGRKTVLQKDQNAYVDNFRIAMSYARLRDKDKTLEYLNRAYEDRSSGITIIKTIRVFEFLRDDPRFQALIKKVGFPE